MLVLEKTLIFMLLLGAFLTGFFSLLNNIHDYPQVIDSFIRPLFVMGKVPDKFSWYRHLPDISVLLKVTYLIMIFLEATIALIASIAIYHWFRGQTAKALRLGQLATLWGIVFWSIGFFLIGGDWFLSWKQDSLKYLQADALRYIQLMFIFYVLLAHYQFKMCQQKMNY